MTNGEQMVWAAAYVGHLAKTTHGITPPPHITAYADRWTRWEQERVVEAVEWAHACVANLHLVYDEVKQRNIPEILAKLKQVLS